MRKIFVLIILSILLFLLACKGNNQNIKDSNKKKITNSQDLKTKSLLSFSKERYASDAKVKMSFSIRNVSNEAITIHGGGTFGDRCFVMVLGNTGEAERTFFVPREGSAATELITLKPGESYSRTFTFHAGSITIMPDLSGHRYGTFRIQMSYKVGDEVIACSAPVSIEIIRGTKGEGP